MQRMMFLKEEQIKLILDPLNYKILELLINEELNPTQISQKLDIPIPTVWRRLNKLEKGGLIEVVKVTRLNNIRSKFYRAKAVYYSFPITFKVSPKDEKVKEIYERFTKILTEIYGLIGKYNTIPPGVDPIDYSVLLDVIANLEVVLEKEEEIRELLEISKKLFFSLVKADDK
ncbi:ArsR/SmtB family transcription factor [Stygiolobus caldivivus]|uniref:HTH arsR-type domain-containing protein n=1 Tax=Stygiolobus caldivivus TaxID=2824673 RepID=A0A8D5U5J2_9CREN|nr:winged helix-turn-helix domain-containing protein [Stygiolobus caldivivus]BCU69940.1 hypothetical protein KN1_12370 [Stygiolobus caldivivus]